MRLTMLGTGNANVTDYYNTCFLLTKETPEGPAHFLVDAGGGNRILKILKDVEVRMEDIHDLFVTHEHVDHILGVIWLVRMIGQKINRGEYQGELHIYCHKELAEKIQAIAEMTIQKKVCRNFGERIIFEVVESGESREILGCAATFFDIACFVMNGAQRFPIRLSGKMPIGERFYQYIFRKTRGVE